MAPFFSQLLDLAAVLLVAPAEATISAGCELYALLMSVFPDDQKPQVRQLLLKSVNTVSKTPHHMTKGLSHSPDKAFGMGH